MNATRWTTLTDFVQHLGREGFCKVDHTDKGWFLQYIDRDPVVLARQRELARREKATLDEEERQQRIIEQQIARAREQAGGAADEGAAAPAATELHRAEDDAR